MRESATAAIGSQENTKPYKSRQGARRTAALNEKDDRALAAVGPQGTASAQPGLLDGGGGP